MNVPPLNPDDKKIKILYKYREINHQNNYTLKNLEDGCLRFSRPSAFNDPFDSMVEGYWNGTEEDWKDWLAHPPITLRKKSVSVEELSNTNFLKKEMQDIKDAYANSFVLSLSEINDSILMWSHYAKSHTGICLGFETKTECNTLGLQFLEKSHSFRLPHCTPGFLPAYRVEYKSDKPSPVNYEEEETDKTEKILQFIKSKDRGWAYERERRVIIPERYISHPKEINEEFVLFEYELSILKEVIFGLKTSDEDKAAIEDCLKHNYPNEGKDINILQVHPIPGKYGMEVKPKIG